MTIQNFDWTPDHRLYSGASGSGKTSLALAQFAKERAKWKFIFDHKGGELSYKLGVKAITDPGDLILATARGGIVSFNPMLAFPGRYREAFVFFCEFIWQVTTSFKGRKILLTDEIQNVLTRGKVCPAYLVLLDTGRSYQLDTLSITRAANRIHCDMREGFTKVFAFRQTDGNATEFLREAGIDENAVRNLPKGKYLWRNLDTGEAGEGGKAL